MQPPGPRLFWLAGIAKATHPGRFGVTKTVYVYEQAGVRFTATMFKGDTFKVERISPSGKWAYGHVNRHTWISAAALSRR